MNCLDSPFMDYLDKEVQYGKAKNGQQGTMVLR
jgi:hypothetical protein